jgi:diadenosine tetraphosphatase ApaH/serine/threonine PP2A family protein phosphatase
MDIALDFEDAGGVEGLAGGHPRDLAKVEDVDAVFVFAAVLEAVDVVEGLVVVFEGYGGAFDDAEDVGDVAAAFLVDDGVGFGFRGRGVLDADYGVGEAVGGAGFPVFGGEVGVGAGGVGDGGDGDIGVAGGAQEGYFALDGGDGGGG